MASPEMEFHLGNTDVKVYVTDCGEYTVEKTFTDRPGTIRVATVADRGDAAYIFNKEVLRLVRKWELEEL